MSIEELLFKEYDQKGKPRPTHIAFRHNTIDNKEIKAFLRKECPKDVKFKHKGLINCKVVSVKKILASGIPFRFEELARGWVLEGTYSEVWFHPRLQIMGQIDSLIHNYSEILKKYQTSKEVLEKCLAT